MRLRRRGPRPKAQRRLWPEPPPEQIWQEPFYDFNVCSEKKETEKLRYMHRDPVKCGLVAEPDQWHWSSFRSYAHHEAGRVRIHSQD